MRKIILFGLFLATMGFAENKNESNNSEVDMEESPIEGVTFKFI